MVDIPETLTIRHKPNLFPLLFAGLTESGFHENMVENTESTEPEVKLIPKKNRDPMDKNSFFKV